MTRDEAITALAAADLARLSPSERAEQLDIMLCESWDADPEWLTVSGDIRSEFDDGELRHSATHQGYDAVLMVWLRGKYAGATNRFLQTRLAQQGIEVAELFGAPRPLEACPCCGARSLPKRHEYAICTICWWEDDGQDNSRADTVMGGPNYHLSLTQARANFLLRGISDPSRTDLRELQDPVEMYERGREFVLSDDRTRIREPAAGWESGCFSLQ